MSLLDLNKIADALYRRLSDTSTSSTAQQYTPTTPNGDEGWMKPYPFAPLRVVNGD